MGSEAGAVAPEVGLGDPEEASSLEERRRAGGQEDFFSLPGPLWAEGRGGRAGLPQRETA